MGYICIHGHFYQPPRENPWLEAVELQESAHPYHDWNERITAECYARNAASRMLDDQRKVLKIVNNYAKISFNFGPTLISWIEAHHPDVYRAILEADAESRANFSGHGSALAQAYSHLIMPLANARDQVSQVAWGVRDFERRFGRQPEGMWLPETAADLATLDVLARFGIKFTILAPSQAKRIRKIRGRNWRDVSGGRIDPTMAYKLQLASGRSIALFFYDGPVSRAIAFEGLLDNGAALAERLVGAFSEDTRPWPELVHTASDGETFGHHHRYGEMGLTFALSTIESNELAEIINYGSYLERHPPTHEAEIFENSSWSCAHGVERWRSNCGCNSGGHPGWNQEWRGPLRQALDWLRDEVAPRAEQRAQGLLKDLWEARNDYIDVILDRSPASVDQFLAKHAAHELAESEKVTALKLLELQRHAMLMYTSCGWFFDEISGIEAVQVLQYAGRVIQISEEALDFKAEEPFLKLLSEAKSNISEFGDGARIYQRFVKPSWVSLKKVAVHYAIRSLFEPYEGETQIYSYKVERESGSEDTKHDGKDRKLVLGRARFTSSITRESEDLCFAAIQSGGYDAIGAARPAPAGADGEAMMLELRQALTQDDGDAIQRFQECFQKDTYTLGALFKDEQQRVLNRIVETERIEAEEAFRQIYPRVIAALRTLTTVGLSLSIPLSFYAIAEFALNTQMRQALAEPEVNLALIESLTADAAAAKVKLDATTLEYSFRTTLERMVKQLGSNAGNLELVRKLNVMVGLALSLPFEVNLWTAQNICYEVLHASYGAFIERAAGGDEAAAEWVSAFNELSAKLSLSVPEEKPAVTLRP